MPDMGTTRRRRRVAGIFTGDRDAGRRLPCLPHALALAAATALAGRPAPAAAQPVTAPGNEVRVFGLPLETFEVVQFSLLAGALAAAIASAAWLIRERARTASQNLALRGKISAMGSRMNQLEALSGADGQRAVVWTDKDVRPAIIGRLDSHVGAPEGRSDFLAFGRWLEPRSAARLDEAISRLRDNAVAFHDVVQTSLGAPVEVIGRTAGGSAVVRFTSLVGERADHARLVAEHTRLVETLDTLKALLNQADMPVWLRNGRGELAWVNRAYAEAVECDGLDAVIARQAELFGSAAKSQIIQQRASDGHFADTVSTVVHGDRLMYDVLDVAGPSGSAGFGHDRTETEAVRAELNTTIRSHEETLDELTTAVAMFDNDARLRFHNQAFQQMWELDSTFLAGKPDMSMFLDRLREEGKLPEQPEWRRWKDDVLGAFQAVESREHWWYLPDGRTVRVIANPHPRGGLTWVFENLTERIDLESRYKTMVRVQGETLDNLAEGVAVFDSDGTLRLANPAFEKFWGVSHLMAHDRVHISAIAQACAARHGDPGPWERFAGIVTGFDEDRAEADGRAQAGDLTLSWMVVPLPNGQTMITFVDITAADQIERALRERNEALERTALLRDRFIRHVSYELRVPLTSISGFAELLEMEATGPLNDKQREYLGHIAASSSDLTELTRDIIDLASVDAGVLELDLATVELQPVMQAVADALRPRFDEHGIELVLRIDPNAGSIVADRARLEQIMINILANAADFAPADSAVTFACERGETGVTFRIRDRGPGIEEAALADVFERFHTERAGRRRGAGLGLAIVKSFVALHDGDVAIKSSSEHGTEVTVSFPQAPARVSVAAQ
ncbi:MULTISPECIES: PAS domain-containing sensor histidine kinase [unclassified Roseitalea]|uniref:sensor histidine kinase n=1 Tax=unclassified Roseitalea TaxID=2639107 RepID=UPI0027402A35|nr:MULTISPECIES: PAS domain-containing sensor histidine kinase [unclassified Roseitalea]